MWFRRHRRVGPLIAAVLLFGLAGCSDGDSESGAPLTKAETADQSDTSEFCEIAETNGQERTADEIDTYYADLEEAAPSEIKEEVATLRNGWDEGSFPTGPVEVVEASVAVRQYIESECGFENVSIYMT